VTHPAFEGQLDAYLDGELAAPDAAELEQHLRACPDCSRLEQRRRALSAAVREQVLRFPAPDTLRARVRSAVRADLKRTLHRRSYWPALAVAASVAVVAVGSWQAGLRHAAGDALADQLLGSHVRSLMPGHLTDVQSSDQHTVKPWFNGKLDFSPPVYDFAGRGFPLIGGRLDYLGERPVAALVYGRRQHIISVFVWPADSRTEGPAAATRRGYHLLHWTNRQYTFWVASDLGVVELREFSGLLQRGDSATQAP